MLLHLAFNFGKGRFGAGSNVGVGACAGCVQSSGGKSQVQRETELALMRIFFKGFVEQNGIRRIAFQESVQFRNEMCGLTFNRFA